MTDVDTFTQAYIAAALWSSSNDEGIPLDNLDAEIAPMLIERAVADCATFQRMHADLLAQAYASELGYDESQAGHDFWLTRCHHGAGFWDRGLGDVGDKLTEAAHATGNADLYIGDDGLIYCA